jgi:hypothetical protein
MLLSPVLANELYTASMRFSNTAVQRLLVQQPIQQRQRTSAKNNSTQRTYNADFKHKMDTGERLRTTCVESPLRHAEDFIRTPPELKQGYKPLEAFLFLPLYSNSTATATTAQEPNYQRSEE